MRYVIVISMCLLQIVVGKRLSTKIYKNIHSYSTCIRLLNGTHQIGCNSVRAGNVGILHHIKDTTDLTWLLNKGQHKPYVVLLTDNMFTKILVDKLRRSGKVNGLLVVNTNQTDNKPSYFSPDKTCPNDDSGMYPPNEHCNKILWNPHGYSLMFVDFNIPIVLLHYKQDVDFLINKCYRPFNAPGPNGIARSYPLCAMQLKVAMDAALDTPTCLRRTDPFTLNPIPEHRCSPLGDHNVYSFVREPKNLAADSVVVLSARLDAFSLFVDIVPAGDSTVTGLVTLLAAAEAIGKVKKDLAPMNRPIVFMLFNGESFDYIGSSRMLYEMEKNNLQQGFQPKHIYTWFELSQVGFGNLTWIHNNPINTGDIMLKNKVANRIATFQQRANDAGLAVDLAPSDQPLPPASVQMFLAKRSFPGLVFTDHQDSYANKYYNSQYDTIAELLLESKYNDTIAHLTHLATAIAGTLYHISTDVVLPTIKANESTVRGLLHCFLKKSQCEMFNRTMENDEEINHLSNTTYSFYIGDAYSVNPLTMLVGKLLMYYLGDHNPKVSKLRCREMDDEEKVFHYAWMQGEMDETTQHRQGVCVVANVRYMAAVSPAFENDDYDWTSRRFSTWSQSAWGDNAMLVRAFLVPSLLRQVLTLSMGICFFLLSLPLVILINRNAPEIFQLPIIVIS